MLVAVLVGSQQAQAGRGSAVVGPDCKMPTGPETDDRMAAYLQLNLSG